jgi:hypothetical protein
MDHALERYTGYPVTDNSNDSAFVPAAVTRISTDKWDDLDS